MLSDHLVNFNDQGTTRLVYSYSKSVPMDVSQQLTAIISYLERINGHLALIVNPPKNAQPQTLGISLKRLLTEYISYKQKHGKGRTGQGTSKATITHYEGIIQRVSNFYKENPETEPTAELLDATWYQDFMDWAITRPKPYSASTIQQCFVMVKQALRFGIAHKKLSKAPALSHQLSNLQPTAPKPLTAGELLKLETFDCPGHLRPTLDAFLFCCYTGFHYADGKLLNSDNVQIDVSGLTYIEKRRQKTNVQSTVPISAKAQAIITKYGSIDAVPFASYSTVWKRLKRLAKLSGVRADLSMSMARDTFADISANDKQMSDEALAGMLGHSDTSNVKRYKRTNIKRIAKEWKE